MYEKQKETALDALMIGEDIKGNRADARAFLNYFMTVVPPEAVKVVLPIARRLLCYKEWPTWNVDLIESYCIDRVYAVNQLEDLVTDTVDPVCDMMVGMVEGLVEKLRAFKDLGDCEEYFGRDEEAQETDYIQIIRDISEIH